MCPERPPCAQALPPTWSATHVSYSFPGVSQVIEPDATCASLGELRSLNPRPCTLGVLVQNHLGSLPRWANVGLEASPAGNPWGVWG